MSALRHRRCDLKVCREKRVKTRKTLDSYKAEFNFSLWHFRRRVIWLSIVTTCTNSLHAFSTFKYPSARKETMEPIFSAFMFCAAVFVSGARGHSWIACTDYVQKNAGGWDPNLCRGFPRNAEVRCPKTGVFGLDRGKSLTKLVKLRVSTKRCIVHLIPISCYREKSLWRPNRILRGNNFWCWSFVKSFFLKKHRCFANLCHQGVNISLSFSSKCIKNYSNQNVFV